jgi:hypothetical protein
MLPQYSDKTSKSKSGSRLDKISNTIKREIFYTKGKLRRAYFSSRFARIQIIEGVATNYT